MMSNRVFKAAAVFGMLSGLSFFSASADQNKSDQFNYETINHNLNAAAQEIVSANPQIKDLSIKLDSSYTDTSKDQYKLDILATLAETVWSKSSSKLEAALRVKALANPESPVGGNKYNVGIDLKLETATLDFLRLVNQAALKYCESQGKKEHLGIKGAILAEKCRVAAKMVHVQSLAELKVLLQEHITTMQSKFTEELQRDSELARVVASQNTILAQEARKAHKKIENMAKALSAVTLTEEKGKLIVTLANIDMRLNKYVRIKNVKAVLSESEAAWSIELDTKLAPLHYRYSKPEIMKLLGALENNEACALDIAKIDLRMLAAFLNDKVVGH